MAAGADLASIATEIGHNRRSGVTHSYHELFSPVRFRILILTQCRVISFYGRKNRVFEIIKVCGPLGRDAVWSCDYQNDPEMASLRSSETFR